MAPYMLDIDICSYVMASAMQRRVAQTISTWSQEPKIARFMVKISSTSRAFLAWKTNWPATKTTAVSMSQEMRCRSASDPLLYPA